MTKKIKICLLICIAIPYLLLNLSLPSLTSAATCNMVDAIIYGYGYSTGGVIQDYSVSGSGCGVAGTGDNVCDALGSGGGGCTPVEIGPGSTHEITIGIQNEGSAPDRYQISWSPPSGWTVVMEEMLIDGSIVEYPSPVNVPTATPGNPSFYNPGEVSYFVFKITTPANFTGSQELVFDVMSLEDNSRVDSVKVVVGSKDILPPAPVVLGVTNVTETSVTVGWTAPSEDAVFFDDFSDGTLAPWSQLFNGVIEVVDDGGNYVMRKTDDGDPNTINTDPNGGLVPLQQVVGDFEMILYTKRVSLNTGANANRYSITDANGNGYGLYLHFDTGILQTERRDAWVFTTLGTGSTVSGGLTPDQWYTLQFTRVGQSLMARAYLGRVEPATSTPVATATSTDSTWSSFSQVNVNGGYDYDTDDIRVNALSGSVTSYDLRYSISPITTNSEFINATKINNCETGESDLGKPKTVGSPESCTVLGLFADTDYYFALKVVDEVGNTSLISICPTCPAHTSKLIDDIRPGNIIDINLTDITRNSVTLCWTAPEDRRSVFFDDFSDGTLAPWSQLFNGVIEVVDDGGNYVMRKTDDGDPNTINTDPNGGLVPLQQVVGDFEMILYTKRVSLNTGANANRYSITDANGNGYGLYLHFDTGILQTERRDAWVFTTLGTGSTVSGGLTPDQWYTLQFTRVGQSLTARAYLGRVEPATSTPVATATSTDSTWSSFSQVNINGGYDYDTDNVQVNSLDNPATGYILKYSTKYIVDDTVTPGMGEISFTDAISAQGLGLPQSPGSQECYTIQVQNILAGNDGILGTLDDIDRTPNTQFFFAIKAEDESYNLSSLSNVVSGLTPMSSLVYNVVSVPKVPNPNTPSSVFGDDVFPSPLYLYRWDSRGVGSDQGCYDGLPGQYNPNSVVPACSTISAINEGQGYFLWSPAKDIVLDVPSGSTDACIDPSLCTCTDELGQGFTCYTLPIKKGWNMIGNPFSKEVDVRALKVRQTDQQGSKTGTFLDAIGKNCIANAIYTYNGSNSTYESCDSTRCDPVLQPWKGYWIWLHQQGNECGTNATYELLIPKP